MPISLVTRASEKSHERKLQWTEWPGSDVLPSVCWDRTKTELLFHLIKCCSLSFYKASVCPKHKAFSGLLLRNRVAGDHGHQLPPSGAEYGKQCAGGFTLKEGCTLLRCQLLTQLPPHALLQWHWCPREDQTQARLSKSLTHPRMYIVRALGPRHQLFGFRDLLLLCHTTW